MKKTFAVIVYLFIYLILTGTSVESFEKEKFQFSFDKLVQSLNEHKISYLKPALSDEFKVEGVPDNYAVEVMKQVIQGYPSNISGYQIEEIRNHWLGYGVTVKVIMDDTIKDYEYILSDSYKFIEIKMFRTMEAAPDEDLSNFETIPDYMEFNFQNEEGMIILDGELDGVAGKFILDTGAPRLIINAEPSYEGEGLSMGSSGVNGALSGLDIKHFDNCTFGKFILNDFDAITTDLSSLEEELGFEILGLIGQSQINNFELFIDYSSKTIKLFKLDEFGTILGNIKPGSPEFKMKFKLASHIPIIVCKVGKQKINFGLDTGAQVNLINETDLYKFQSFYAATDIDTLYGADNSPQEVSVGDLTGVSIKNKTLPAMETVISDISHINNATDEYMEGILGYELFKQQPISLNFLKQRISFY